MIGYPNFIMDPKELDKVFNDVSGSRPAPPGFLNATKGPLGKAQRQAGSRWAAGGTMVSRHIEMLWFGVWEWIRHKEACP